jgi:capsular polysaccharide biosynthesis protein
MSPQESRGQAPRSFDPEAEQEVDFGRYGRLLGARWWVVAAGVVVGAIVGYAVSLGGSQTFKATATLYLGQPYTASGNVQLQGLQTNPSTVSTVAHSVAVDQAVAGRCKTKTSSFRSGISSKAIAGSLVKNGQNPLVSLSVQARRRKVAACAANELADVVLTKIGRFANVKIASFRNQIGSEEKEIKAINTGIQSPGVSSTDKLLLQVQLHSAQDDLTTATQLLHQATDVEAPKLLTPAAAQRVTARSRRNSVVVAALIGLVLGVIAALMWDGIAAGFSRRRTV